MQKSLMLAAAAAAALSGCGQQKTLKYKIGECTYAGDGTDWKHTGTDTNGDGRDSRASGEARRSHDGTQVRSIEEALGLYRRIDMPDEWSRVGHRVGQEQDNRHIQLTVNHEMRMRK